MKNSAKKNGELHDQHYENGNGVGAGVLAAGGAPYPEIVPDAESHEYESDLEHQYLGNGSLEASYTEEPSETTDEASARDHEEAALSPVDQAEKPEELIGSHSPELFEPVSDPHAEGGVIPDPSHEVSVDAADDEEPKQGQAKDDIADIVGLLESTSFTSKHILQGSDESVATNSHTPGSDKERQRIGEIPDEE